MAKQLTLSQPGGRLYPPQYYEPPRIFRPCDRPACSKQLISFEFIFSGDDQAFCWRTSEEGVFDNVLPFTEFTMTGQDKNEDIMEALSIDESKKPYFTYLVYFVTLAAIKKKNFEATKVSFQMAIILSHLLNYPIL